MNTFVGVDIIIAIWYILIKTCSLWIGKVLKYQDFFNNVELSYNDFANICNKAWKEPYNYTVIHVTKNKIINGKLRINWDRRVL